MNRLKIAAKQSDIIILELKKKHGMGYTCICMSMTMRAAHS